MPTRSMPALARWEWRLGMVLALAVAGNILVYLAVVRPLEASQEGHHHRILALRRQILALQEQGRTLGAQLKTLQDVEDYREGLPERNWLVGLSGELTALAESLAVRMPGITYQPEPLAEVDLLRVRLSLGVEGSYAQVRRFLHELEKRRRYLVVERMGLGETKGTTPTNHVAMQLSLAGYFR
jgi:hypothetical protein